jgi:hypothetical protein
MARRKNDEENFAIQNKGSAKIMKVENGNLTLNCSGKNKYFLSKVVNFGL